MASTHKKVVVRKMDRDTINGFVGAQFISEGRLELLNTAGNVVMIDLQDIKGIYFVRDFNDTEDLTRKTFTTRPRAEGLWVRLKFRDNDLIEGLMPNDLLQVTSDGLLVSPPDTRSNIQRIFVPRSALTEMTVLGVIGEKIRRKATDERQVSMFQE